MSWWQGLGDGKSVLATQNIVEGIGQGDPGIVVVFEERLQEYSMDLTMHEILDAVRKIGAKRRVIDSLAAFEMGLGTRLRRRLSRIALPGDHRFDRSRGCARLLAEFRRWPGAATVDDSLGLESQRSQLRRQGAYDVEVGRAQQFATTRRHPADWAWHASTVARGGVAGGFFQIVMA